MTDKPAIHPILNDLPTDKDELDFQPYVEAWAISCSTQPPVRRWYEGYSVVGAEERPA